MAEVRGRDQVPQPDPSRLVDFDGHPLVVAVAPGQSSLVVLTAISLARAVGAGQLVFAFCDESRCVVSENPDGSVVSEPLDPDGIGGEGEQAIDDVLAAIKEQMAGTDIPWRLELLAGRPDRALTHLARAVDAAAFVVGARSHRRRRRVSEFITGSVAANLAHHQHRPVLVVPTQVVDWKDSSPWQ